MRRFRHKIAAHSEAIGVLPALDEARSQQQRFLGESEGLSREQRIEAIVRAAAESAIESSAIEGEKLDLDSVRSSVARRLGVETSAAPQDDRTEGVVAMTLDATRNFEHPLTAQRLFAWQADLFPISFDARRLASVGHWRSPESDPMQVISGPIGKPTVHFEAPAAAEVPRLMDAFFAWFEASRERENGLIRAAIAHLWLLTIHPFEDGNGRIARAIADMALSQDERSGDRFYSMSAQIHRERRAYYTEIERAQKGTLDITDWIVWFLACLSHAVESSRDVVIQARRATRFWQRHEERTLNARQRRVLRRLLGPFVGGDVNLRKYMAMTDASRATAQRDLAELVEWGILVPQGSARATRYKLQAPPHARAADGGMP